MFIKLPFFNKKKKPTKNNVQLDTENLPNHVAIIMDGNGRWAKKRGLPRIAGHREGMMAVKKIVRKSVDHDIQVLTLYAFSTENWKRPKPEVEYIMKLPDEFLNTFLPELIEQNVRVENIGDFDHLPTHTKEAVQTAMEKTKKNDGLILNFALNYGSRGEMVQAVRRISEDVQEGTLSTSDIDHDLFSSYLSTNKLPDPDLLIRTSGEFRLSNFLLWQLAYTEFWFTEVLWPDFNEYQYEQALFDYQQRKRRYGGI